MYIVYYHKNIVNGKIYVGSTKLTIQRRWNNGLGYKKQPAFYSDIVRYGWENFKHVIVGERLSESQAQAMERLYIQKFNSANPLYGYNQTLSGQGRLEPNGVLKTKISESLKGKYVGDKNHFYGKYGKKHPWYGHHHTEETRQKMSISHKGEKHSFYGKHLSEETRQKISSSLKGKCVGDSSPHFGKHPSEETRKKMSEAAKKRRAKAS